MKRGILKNSSTYNSSSQPSSQSGKTSINNPISKPPQNSNDNSTNLTSRSSSASSLTKRKLKWDEVNIVENELTKASLPHTKKITEPKTPFIHYNADTDQILGASVAKLLPLMELGQASTNATEGQSVSSGNGGGWTTTDDESESESDENGQGISAEESEKKKKFANLRSQHYRIGDLLKGKKLSDIKPVNDDDDDDDDDDDEMSLNDNVNVSEEDE